MRLAKSAAVGHARVGAAGQAGSGVGWGCGTAERRAAARRRGWGRAWTALAATQDRPALRAPVPEPPGSRNDMAAAL